MIFEFMTYNKDFNISYLIDLINQLEEYDTLFAILHTSSPLTLTLQHYMLHQQQNQEHFGTHIIDSINSINTIAQCLAIIDRIRIMVQCLTDHIQSPNYGDQ